MPIKITTNNRPVEIVYWNELTEKEQKEFDWMDEENQEQATFFRYKGNVEFIGDFMYTESFGPKWSGASGTSAWTGILIQHPFIDNDGFRDFDHVRVGWFQEYSQNVVKEWVAYSGEESKTDLYGAPCFWHNKLGWAACQYTLFAEYEKGMTTLPLPDGKWLHQDEAKRMIQEWKKSHS